MTAFIDIVCQFCGHRYGWCGEMADARPCPHCGEPPNKRELAETEAIVNAARKQMDAEAAAEWAARTPEQEAAYHAGRAAYTPGTNVSHMLRHNPYSPRNSGQPDHPLRGWWARGWNAMWGESMGE